MTWARYQSALNGFATWCHENAVPTTSFTMLDWALQGFIHAQYFEGASRQSCVNTLAGLIICIPSARRNLECSRLCLKGWATLKPSISWPPFSWDTASLVAATMLSNGSSRAAFCLLLAFDCLLRVSELCALRVRDIAAPSDPRLGAAAPKHFALLLRQTKTGRNLWVQVLSPVIVQLFPRFLAGLAPEQRLLPLSPAKFRSLLRASCVKIGFKAHFTPHSLRHGGATHMFLLRYSLEDILHRGRWKSTASARRYIQAGQAHLLQLVENGTVLA